MSVPSLARVLAIVCAVVVCLPVAAVAQEPQQEYLAPPHLSVIEGSVDLIREGRVERAELGQILAAGDRIRTGGGRLEILFGDGSALHLDEQSTLDLLDEGLVRLLDGRVLLHIANSDDRFEYRIDTPAGSVFSDVPGEYRVTVTGDGQPAMELAVARGLASATTPGDSVALRAGQMVRVRLGARPERVLSFNAADWDRFERWSYERRYGTVDRYASNLTPALSPYARTLGHYGTWSHHHTHGAVWYPRVGRDWRPFYHGRWSSIAPYGWTWIGIDRWAWPTHYYGTWGVTTAGAWFWIPGRHWRPAPVHWTITAAHVGWVPWGYGGVDVFGFTVIPRSVFSVNVFVPRHVVRTHTIRPVIRNVFVAQPPPHPRNLAVPRAFRSVRVAEPRRAVPRYAAGAAVQAASAESNRPSDSAAVRGGAATGRRTAVDRRPTTRADEAAAPGRGAASSVNQGAGSRFPERTLDNRGGAATLDPPEAARPDPRRAISRVPARVEESPRPNGGAGARVSDLPPTRGTSRVPSGVEESPRPNGSVGARVSESPPTRGTSRIPSAQPLRQPAAASPQRVEPAAPAPYSAPPVRERTARGMAGQRSAAASAPAPRPAREAAPAPAPRSAREAAPRDAGAQRAPPRAEQSSRGSSGNGAARRRQP